MFFSSKTKNSTISLSTPANFPSSNPSTTFAKVIKVYDGDTIEIDTGQKVRYIGVDTTEIYPSQKCFSQEAKSENESLVLDKTVELVKDVNNTDKYGRLLRFVYFTDPNSGKHIFVNDFLVRAGFAKVMTVPPDTEYKDQFTDSENYAKENKLGLWGKCF